MISFNDFSIRAKVSCLQAHGTGTPVGDPIEVEAISNSFSKDTSRPILIGPVKPNMGHGGGVSGLTSLIKSILILENGMIPPTIGIQKINSDLRLEERNVRVVQQPTPMDAQPARVSVNSFGYGGANAHCILEGVKYHIPNANDSIGPVNDRTTRILLLPMSAHTYGALELLNTAVQQMVHNNVNIDKLAHTLAHRQSDFKINGVLIAKCEAMKGQDATVNLSSLKTLCSFPDLQDLPPMKPRTIAYAFTGQGSQWRSMARGLFQTFSKFRETIKTLDRELSPTYLKPSWSLEGKLRLIDPM